MTQWQHATDRRRLRLPQHPMLLLKPRPQLVRIAYFVYNLYPYVFVITCVLFLNISDWFTLENVIQPADRPACRVGKVIY